MRESKVKVKVKGTAQKFGGRIKQRENLVGHNSAKFN